MIELAAAVWDLSPQATLHKLARLDVVPAERASPEDVAAYIRKHPQVRKRMLDMWRQAREYIATAKSPDLNRLRERFRLHHQLNRERWERGPGHLLGALPRRVVEKTFYPKGPAQQGCTPHVYNSGNTNDRIFMGRGWGEVLVVPYYDMPERVCGFFMVGRKGRPEDKVFRCPSLFRNSMARYEAGLAGLWSVDESKACLGKFVLAFDDPLLALRIQLRHFATSYRPLPVVAYYDDGRFVTRDAWRCLEYRVPVFWTPTETLRASTVHQAVIANGYISLPPGRGFDPAKLDHFIRENEPRALAHKLVKRALPWREALVAWADKAERAPVEELVLGLAQYGHDLREIAGLSERLAEVASLPPPARVVHVGNVTVVERDGRWWHRGKHGERLVLNAVLRVDGVTVKEVERHGRVTCYKGRLIHDGDEIPFEIPVTVAERHGERELQDLLAKAKGAALYAMTRWQKRLFDAGKLFGRPNFDA